MTYTRRMAGLVGRARCHLTCLLYKKNKGVQLPEVNNAPTTRGKGREGGEAGRL
jgi:hypothetical protein